MFHIYVFKGGYQCGAVSGISMNGQLLLLPIDECEEWIWDSLNCTEDCGFEYIKDGNKEFLICNTNDFFADANVLERIRKTTGMELIQISTHKGHTQLWFGRYTTQKKNWTELNNKFTIAIKVFLGRFDDYN